MSRAAAVVLLLVANLPGAAETFRVSDPSELRKAATAAGPGDTVLLAPGDYAGNFYFRNLHGTAGQPMVIAAADPNRPPRFVGPRAPLHFGGASHLELKDLVITGSSANGLNIDDGGDADRPSHHITLRNIRVHDVGPRGNVDGIKLSGVDDLLVERCTVERWGSGGSAIDLVGCHRGVISGATFRKGVANAIQAKGGSSEITVRKCRFEDAGQRAVNLGRRP